MTRKPVSNVAASVRQRLMNHAKATKRDFAFVLTRYAIERLLYRISLTPAANTLVLKGAALLYVWTGEEARPTRDADFLRIGSIEEDELRKIFRAACQVNVPGDGVVFQPDDIRVETIREHQEYGGMRIMIPGKLEHADATVYVDIAAGDVITPASIEIEYPTLLEMERPRLKAYPVETVIAEKLEAMVKLGIANSRMKDFHDVWTLVNLEHLKIIILRKAVHATFGRRQTEIPAALPLALTARFYDDHQKQAQWHAFVKRLPAHHDAPSLDKVVGTIAGLWQKLRL
ncbi:MAG: nucleotidyl transferase AbiEii/AbiGii toxin family protein [Candidatus Sumerlaeaceae bacterium]